jgi:hypothetical protein
VLESPASRDRRQKSYSLTDKAKKVISPQLNKYTQQDLQNLFNKGFDKEVVIHDQRFPILFQVPFQQEGLLVAQTKSFLRGSIKSFTPEIEADHTIDSIYDGRISKLVDNIPAYLLGKNR